ncbi:hypothetical protein [Enterovibrio paralichthyis]|nr:hypothetical protein [Enterovibrio paralichthyis]
MKKLLIGVLVLVGVMGTAHALDMHLMQDWHLPGVSFFGCGH